MRRGILGYNRWESSRNTFVCLLCDVFSYTHDTLFVYRMFNMLYITCMFMHTYVAHAYTCVHMHVSYTNIYTSTCTRSLFSPFQLVQASLLGLGTLGTKMFIGKLLGVKDDVRRHIFFT